MAKRTAATQTTISNIAERAPYRGGSHINFHDLEREDILRKTEGMVRLNPDIARLHGLLADAHERLADAHEATDALKVAEEDAHEATDALKVAKEDAEALREAAKDVEQDRDNLSKEVDAAAEDLRDSEKERDTLSDRIEAMVDRIVEMNVEYAERNRQVSELQEVEPLATAFVLCWKAALLRKGNMKLFTAEQKIAVLAALKILDITEADIT